jgi:hypothetical protein
MLLWRVNGGHLRQQPAKITPDSLQPDEEKYPMTIVPSSTHRSATDVLTQLEMRNP